MRIEDISQKDLEALNIMNFSSRIALSVPAKVKPAKALKLKFKVLDFFHEEVEELDEELKAYLFYNTSGEEFFELLNSAEKELELRGDTRHKAFDEDFVEFEPELRDALWRTTELINAIEIEEDMAKIVLEDVSAFKSSLILGGFSSNVSFNPIDDCIYVKEFSRGQKGYKLICEMERYNEETDEDEIILFEICFETVRLECQVFRCDEGVLSFENPWDLLGDISGDLIMKQKTNEKLLNQKEKELLPLLKEIDLLNNSFGFTDGDYDFTLLKGIAQGYGYSEIIKQLEKIEKLSKATFKTGLALKQATVIMSQKKYEPMWRSVFNSIKESQKDYHNKADILCDGEILKNVRKDIEEKLRSYGFEGEYPDFYKTKDIMRIRLAENYGKSYFIGGEKNCGLKIHCREFYYGSVLTVDFLCGTDLSKGRACEDVYSCSFDDKGHRLLGIVSYNLPLKPLEGEEPDDLDTVVSIASKKTESKSLTKEERKHLYGEGFGLGTFLTTLIFFGGLFAILMTAAMFLICVIVTVLLGFGDDLSGMISAMPWGFCFAFSWIGCGVLMGIFETISKRK